MVTVRWNFRFLQTVFKTSTPLQTASNLVTIPFSGFVSGWAIAMALCFPVGAWAQQTCSDLFSTAPSAQRQAPLSTAEIAAFSPIETLEIFEVQLGYVANLSTKLGTLDGKLAASIKNLNVTYESLLIPVVNGTLTSPQHEVAFSRQA
ncbi:MAG: hypothetical protein RBT63_10005, partial [Bdellovibrionales bacterium]|nr:hypothetical protein [Bdellovibrionales bacterium]